MRVEESKHYSRDVSIKGLCVGVCGIGCGCMRGGMWVHKGWLGV